MASLRTSRRLLRAISHDDGRAQLPYAGWCKFLISTSTKDDKRSSITSCSTEQPTSPDVSQLSQALQSQWHQDRNTHLGSILIKPHSGRKVWWSCDQCPDGHPHEWEAAVTHRSNGIGCPFCTSKAVCQHNSLATEAPDVAAEFSQKNQGSASDYTSSSSQKVTWVCQHGHEWTATILGRTRKHPTGCPICYDARRRLPHKRQPTLTDSHHPMMQLWDWELNSKAGFDPSKITCGSAKRPHWICHQCPKGQPHRWRALVHSVFRGSRCPCCSGQQACVCNSLQSLHPDIAAEWDYSRNKGTPSNYSAHSNAQVWCSSKWRGRFKATINSRTRPCAHST